MTPAHTPGPWTREGKWIVGTATIHTNGRERNSLGISSASYSESVAQIHGDLELPGPMANAERIVMAVNAYDELVEALKGAIDCIESEFCSHSDVHGPDNSACYAREQYAALAKAGVTQ